jgi:excisionase family DNA binding protein
VEERHFSLSQVARILGKSERTIRRWIKLGRLRAYRPGRDYLIPESALRELMEMSEVPKVEPPLPLLESVGDGGSSGSPAEERWERAEHERLVIEGLFGPWVGWLMRDAAYLTAVTYAGGLDRGAHAKILADRKNTLQALDELGTALEGLGLDWTDQRNRVLRRAHRDLQSAFNDWTGAWLEARTTYVDSLAGSELKQARRAHDEEEEHSEHMAEWLRAG